jgi:hypothetical protein
MVYSDAFDGLPAWDRDRIYRKLYDVLTNKNTSPRFARISTADRANVLEILRETKPGLPDYFKAPSS